MSTNWGDIVVQAAMYQDEMRRREANYLKRGDTLQRKDNKRSRLTSKLIPMVRIIRSQRPQPTRNIRPQHETS
jgi:hypothetical protein